MENAVKPVQNAKKKRSQADKVGRLKYNQQLLKQTLAEVEEVKLMLRTIFAGLKGSFNFEQSLIERVVCEDEVDREILRLLFEAGGPGLLPKDLAVKLGRFKVARHQVSRRIMPMNKRLEKEFGECVAEQRLALGVHKFCYGSLGRNRNPDVAGALPEIPEPVRLVANADFAS